MTTTDDELNILHYNVRDLLNKEKELGDLQSNCGGKNTYCYNKRDLAKAKQ